MVSGFSTDYAGRQVDLLAMDVTPSTKRQRARLRFSDPEKVTAGVQQAVQCFIGLLLTKQGTARNVFLGSPFLSRLQRQPPRSVADLRNAYNVSIREVIQQANLGAQFIDEQIVSAPLIDAVVAEGSISMTIQINTAAGVSATYLTPIEGV